MNTAREQVLEGKVLDYHGRWRPVEEMVAYRDALYEHLSRGEVEVDGRWVKLEEYRHESRRSVGTDELKKDTPAETAPEGGRTAPRADRGRGELLTITGEIAASVMPPRDVAGRTVHVVRLSGSVRRDNGRELETILDTLFDRGYTRLVIDMTSLEHMSSTGWSALSAKARHFAAAGGSIKICCIPQTLFEPFLLLKFDRIFRPYPSCDVCLEEIGREPRPGGTAGTGPGGGSGIDMAPLAQRIRRLIANQGPLSIFSIRRLLRRPEYGGERIGLAALYRVLRANDLETRKKRRRFFRSA